MADPWTHLELATHPESFASDDVEVLGVRGVETVSRPFRYEVDLVCRDEGLDPRTLEEILERPCSLTWGPTGENAVHGVVNHVRIGSVEPNQPVRYQLVIEPPLSRLRYWTRSRVFQDMTTPDIVAAVLAEHGLADTTRFRLAEEYPPREYVLQYEESDLDFVQRLLEHVGIHYHFEHEVAVEAPTLVVTDTNAGLTDHGAPVDYLERQPAHLDREAVHTLERELGHGPAQVVLTEYNWRRPGVSLTNQADVDAASGLGLFHEHGNHYKSVAEGAVLARVRAQQLACERLRYRAEVTLFGVSAGQRIHLRNHPSGECTDRDYVVVRRELEVRGGGGAVHRDVLDLADFALPYRPPRDTPRPKIHGVLHGVVDAPAHSTAAPVDDDGRYTVLLPFDLNGQPGGRATRRIRVAQPSSGPGHGMHLPMHLGAEVAIVHLGGDPDRPVIVGSVHNADTKNPVATGNATQSWIKTQAGVRVLFDDDVH